MISIALAMLCNRRCFFIAVDRYNERFTRGFV